MGVLSDVFATVDLREELCHHSRPKEAKSEEHGTGNIKGRKPCAAEKAEAGPERFRGTAPLRRAFRFGFPRCLFSWRVLVSAPARVSARVTSRRSRDVSFAADLFKTSTRRNPTPQAFPQIYPNMICNKKILITATKFLTRKRCLTIMIIELSVIELS